MPQFDFYSFYEQVSLVLAFFLLFYFIFVKFYFVNFSKAIKTRLKLKSLYDRINNKNNTLKVKSLFL